jgi:hypothetical protein
MKKINVLISTALLCMFLILSCDNNDNSVNIEAPGSVAVQAGYGEAIFTWSFPSDSNAEFIRVDYLDAEGVAKHQKFSRNTTSAVIPGLDEREYEFTVTASDLDNNRSQPVVVKATPNKPPYLLVVNSINAVPDFGGIVITWTNETGKNVGVNVKYIDINGLPQVFASSSAELNGSATLSGLSADQQKFEIYTTSANGAKSPSKFFNIAPFYEVKFVKTTWSIFGFSSQEAGGEGPVNGYATAAIDGNTGTFWHSKWSGGTPPYPHWFAVDMKQLKVVSKVVLFTRNGDKRGMTKFSLEGSLDGVTWEPAGEYNFDNTIFTGQSYTLAKSMQMRYIKMTALKGPNAFTFLAELDVYGQ